jgi:hypothetical protein
MEQLQVRITGALEEYGAELEYVDLGLVADAILAAIQETHLIVPKEGLGGFLAAMCKAVEGGV